MSDSDRYTVECRVCREIHDVRYLCRFVVPIREVADLRAALARSEERERALLGELSEARRALGLAAEKFDLLGQIEAGAACRRDGERPCSSAPAAPRCPTGDPRCSCQAPMNPPPAPVAAPGDDTPTCNAVGPNGERCDRYPGHGGDHRRWDRGANFAVCNDWPAAPSPAATTPAKETDHDDS